MESLLTIGYPVSSSLKDSWLESFKSMLDSLEKKYPSIN